MKAVECGGLAEEVEDDVEDGGEWLADDAHVVFLCLVVVLVGWRSETEERSD